MGPFIPRKDKPALMEGPTARQRQQWAERYDRGQCPCGCGLSRDNLRSMMPEAVRVFERTGDWEYAWTIGNA